MTDGTGTTNYAYVPVGSLGALKLQSDASPLADSTIAYGYDALGRVVSRSVAGEGSESFGYDAIGRLTSHTSDLGAFALSYLGETEQITLRQLSGSSLATAWSYLPNSGDRRLAGIANTGLATGQYSNYTYTTIPENFITGNAETSDQPTVYPTAGTQTASYNTLNQLTDLSGQALSYDADGNLLSDGTRTYSWDAQNRLVGITYPGTPGKATAFDYDGLGRRIAITSTPSGGGAVTTSYIWCGSRPCQARNASDTPTREYYPEGELVPGSPAQPYYYGTDQLGSVRRVFASTTSASAYSYDPYGNPLQTTAPLTDYGYAGMFYNADSRLDLTQYRAYNPATGRWLSRDPIGEMSDAAANLYAYVQGRPIDLTDPLGLCYDGSNGIDAFLAFLGDASLYALGEVADAAIAAAALPSAIAGGILALTSTSTAGPDQDEIQYVVRAGAAAPSSLQTGTSSTINGYGFSVQTAPGVLPEQLASGAPNITNYGQYSFTTVQQLQSIPGVTVNAPTPGQGAYHGTVNIPYPAPAGIFNSISSQFQQQSNPFFVPK